MAGTTDILIVDDSKTVQHMLQLILNRVDDFRVVGIAATAKAACAAIEKLRPRVVTLDLSLPDAQGLDFLASLTSDIRNPVQAIVLTGSEGQRPEALAHGAFACFEKSKIMDQIDDFRQAIRDAAMSPLVRQSLAGLKRHAGPRSTQLRTH